jgi:serine/threonine-protein phosphatase 2A activator
MIKMYSAEVLDKLPVIQHFLFGSIIPYDGPPPPTSGDRDDPHFGHAHARAGLGAVGQEAGWGDCCGIPVPSAFAAREAEKKQPGLKIAGPGIRPVPFD